MLYFWKKNVKFTVFFAYSFSISSHLIKHMPCYKVHSNCHKSLFPRSILTTLVFWEYYPNTSARNSQETNISQGSLVNFHSSTSGFITNLVTIEKKSIHFRRGWMVCIENFIPPGTCYQIAGIKINFYQTIQKVH